MHVILHCAAFSDPAAEDSMTTKARFHAFNLHQDSYGTDRPTCSVPGLTFLG